MLINNFLDDETFNNIKNIITSNDMPWYTRHIVRSNYIFYVIKCFVIKNLLTDLKI